ncbi:MAG: cystathionine gamma-synthase [Chloroflexi bacterium RBG_16_63_12]|nr:MAG: cystathionine gamma-synthase [Chloroflexi bacterium RBG_16_63_12]
MSDMMNKNLRFETLAIHAGQEPDPATGAVMTPIYQTSTYVQQGVGEHKGYEYARTSNPTRTALEACLAALEGAQFGLAFASGMAAIDTVLKLLDPGDHVLASNDVYGGTFRLFDKQYKKYGVEFSYVESTDLNEIGRGLRPNTKFVWLETPTNPRLKVADIRAISEVAHKHHPASKVIVDNTFATPYLQRPLALGADVVLHSTTKYLGGHSDVVGGAVLTSDAAMHERLKFLQNAAGAVPGPMDCFLVLRGIKTLPLRMDRHGENALAVAQFLADHLKVTEVIYPGLESHPQHTLAARQMRNGGGMISFFVQGGDAEAAARELVKRTQLFALAESLGGVESLIELPSAMTHGSTKGSPLEVQPGLIRISVGLENKDDLIEDLAQALKQG